MTATTAPGFVAYLATFISEHRRERIEQVLRARTRWLTVVLEDVYQGHNASAVLRTCDAFGIQDVHAIETRNRYKVNPQVDLGASRWLTVNRHAALADCARALRGRGYRLLAASPHGAGVEPEEVAIDTPVAVLLGTEEQGLSAEALAMADQRVKVPMLGFSESLNVSVCAALILRELARRLRRETCDWQLSPDEQADLRLAWYRRSVRGAELLETRFQSTANATPGPAAPSGDPSGYCSSANQRTSDCTS